ncbi:MAG: hypothetical protein K0R65_2176 [Crocinitomicaceae bacterium]|nr:hypothetical protein [Crocinitomicaceae bacterium]
MNKLYTLALLLLGFAGFSQAQLNCGDSYIDSGGPTGEYSDDEYQEITICPSTPGEVAIIVFTSFDTEAEYDSLTIYNGNSTADMMIGSYYGTNSPGTVVSTNPNGCLTLVWSSDGSVTYPGWEAITMCEQPTTCPSVSDLLVNSTTETTASIGWTAGGAETQWAVEYGPVGFSPGQGTEVITSNNPLTLNGLMGTSAYQYYVRAICGPADTSYVSGPMMFTTDMAPFICGNLYMDNGAYGDYGVNTADTTTICPTNPGDIVLLDFSMFSVEEGYDSLMIFNGNSIMDDLIGTYTGVLDPFTVYSTNPNGCLTAMFWSDDIVEDAGWQATINCVPPITCFEPSDLMVDDASDVTATLSWTPGGAETQWVVEYGPEGFAEGAGTVVLATTNPFTISGLSGLTTYDYYVRSYCGGTDTSFSAGPVTFMTSPEPFICGNIFIDNGGFGEYSNDVNDTVTICPTTPGQVVLLDFSMFYTEGGYDSLTIYNGNSTNDNIIGSYQDELDPFTVYSTNPNGCLTAVFASDFTATYPGWEASINCIDPITCFEPTNLMSDASTASTATVSWTAGGTETQWVVEYGLAGFAEGTGTTILATSNPFTITGLMGSTAYDYYVRSYCGGTDTSFSAGPQTFATEIAPFVCGNLFVDNGGAFEYSNDSADTTTICPTGDYDFVEVNFTSFETEQDYDSLMVFNGNSTMGTLMGTYQGTNSPGVVTSTSPDGCLTFVFHSDVSQVYSGWSALIDCQFYLAIDESAQDLVTVYPNPSTGKFTIENMAGSTLSYTVNDMQGRSLNMSVNTSAAESTIDLSNYDNGVYFLVVSNGTSTKTYSLVKN